MSRSRLPKRHTRSVSFNIRGYQLDFSLLATVLVLTLFGLIMVYDVSIVQAYQDYGDKYYYIKQQLLWVSLGLAGLFFFSYFSYHNLRRLAVPIFGISFLLLLAVFIPGLGTAAGGAHRWLKIGPVTIQPTEIIKLSTIIFLASLFEKKRGTFGFGVVVLGITFILGILQKDLGSTIVFFLTSGLLYLLSGAPINYFLIGVPVTLIGFLGFVLPSPYRRQRILAFLDPQSDPTGYSYHISQVLIALGSGGWAGLGLGQSIQKFEYIPEVTTDSIFAIIGEEFGFIGGIFLILLISFLIYRALLISHNAPDRFGQLLGYGLTLWLGIQAALNLAAMVALVPLTGVPLPFISYGGSALLANLVAVGILLNISRVSKL